VAADLQGLQAAARSTPFQTSSAWASSLRSSVR
jgi:hypothetical protein